MEREKTLERKLAKEVKKAGGYAIKLVPLHLSGLPDRMCLFPGGRIVFVEVKGTGEKPRMIQEFWLKRLANLGFDARVVDSTGGINEIIEKYA